MKTNRDRAHRIDATCTLLMRAIGQFREEEFDRYSSSPAPEFDEIWVQLGKIHSQLYDVRRLAQNVWGRESLD